MNIENLLEKASLFKELVIESGLYRDLQDYQNTLNQNHNRNLIFMNDINDKIQSKLIPIYDSSLPNDLEILIKQTKPFTERKYLIELIELKNKNDIDSDDYHNKFSVMIDTLYDSIQKNFNEIVDLANILEKYTVSYDDINTSDDFYPICLKFNDKKTTNGLKDFHRSLRIWNITLLNYQTLISSESPEQIKIQSINDGCIELVFEYAWDIAERFANVIDTFTTYYAAFLFAKNSINTLFSDKTVVSKKVKDNNNVTIKLMFDEMESNLKDFIKKQIKEAKKNGIKNTTDGSDTKKIEVITKTVIDHFVKGNEIKFLMAFHDYDEEDEEEIKNLPIDVTKNIRKNSVKAQKEYKLLKEKDKQLLLEKYTIENFDDLEKNNKGKK